jgi:hydroxyacylglutathione hydrolase
MATQEQQTDQTTETERVAREYFGEAEHGVTDHQERHYAPDAVVTVQGVFADGTREDVKDMFRGIRGAFPDFAFEILDITAQEDRAAVRWHMTGTFAGPEPYAGYAPTGGRLDLQGVDCIRVAGGKIVENNAYTDNTTVGRQLGLMPPAGSPVEERMTRAINAKTGVARRVGAGAPEQIADGVWVLRGGFPLRTMNVYFVQDGAGVLMFDAGIKAMTNAIAAAAASLGGLTRVVLGHAHEDHRGAAPGLGVDVLCHAADRADAEGDGGRHYMDLSKLNPVHRRTFPVLLSHWDGGPVQIAGTVAEGDDVAGFEVVHLPGHAPGLIALWRESDRLALASDTFYTLDPLTGRKGQARVPHPAFNQDTEQARASIRKLAALAPATAWAGHADPLTGDVAAQLERAASTT